MAEEVVVDSQMADVLALSESMLQKERQEGVINVLADPANLARFTDIGRKEPQLFGKMLYEHMDIAAIRAWEDNGGDYIAPEMPDYLFRPDWHLRTSKLGKLIGVFRSISHLTEGGQSGGRIGFFGRRKG